MGLEKINFVFAFDNSYLQHFSVACISLVEHEKDNIQDIYVLTSSINKNLIFFKDFIFEKFEINIIPKIIDDTIFKGFYTSHHISISSYYRLLIADLVPSSIEHIVYLDSDIIIKSKFIELLPITQLDTKPLYAVNHRFNEESLRRLYELGFKGDYFNAGVFLINLAFWRDQGYTKKALLLSKKYKEKLVFWDQDVLNLIFQSNWGELNPSLNGFGLQSKGTNCDYFRIIHFTGSSKPWHFNSSHPYRKYYKIYYRKSPFFKSINRRKFFTDLPRYLKYKILNKFYSIIQ